jgi:hypothetical protein
MTEIFLTKGKVAIVDADDFEYLNQWKWLFDGKGYAVRHEPRQKGKHRGWIYMHRLINNTPSDLETDHINHNRLDNRKSNLRAITHQKNLFNSKIAKNNTSGCKGVTKAKGKWQAQIVINQKNIYLGYYYDIEEAIRARTEAELKYHAI